MTVKDIWFFGVKLAAAQYEWPPFLGTYEYLIIFSKGFITLALPFNLASLPLFNPLMPQDFFSKR